MSSMLLLFSSLSGLTLLFYFHLKIVKMTMCVSTHFLSCPTFFFFSDLLDTSNSEIAHVFIFFIAWLK